jgi:hypothetical protein
MPAGSVSVKLLAAGDATVPRLILQVSSRADTPRHGHLLDTEKRDGPSPGARHTIGNR